MMKNTRIAFSTWILIGVGLLSFLTMFTYLLSVITSKGSVSIIDLRYNVLGSFPFIVGVACADYMLVRSICRVKWLCDNLVVRVIFEFAAMSILAVIFLLIGSLPFKYDGDFTGYINSMFYAKAIMPAVILNIFIIIIIEFLVQSQQRKQREMEFERLQSDNLKMQYRQLKEQINPHFLFNSLNALISLINKDSDRATTYTKKLSEVYRYVLTYDMQDVVKVADEIEFIRNYIDILYIRFDKGLSVEIDVLKGDCDRQILPMALQVLVENAVKHNVVSPLKQLHVSISSDGEYLTVTNNLSPRSRVEPSTGIGLKNLSNKYHILTNKDIVVKNDCLQFAVKIPLL